MLSGLLVLFLLFDGAIKLVPLEIVTETSLQLGIPTHLARTLGVLTLAGALLYAIPRTSVLGAILLTGYLGGAVNTHVHHGDGWIKILFPVFFGALFWLGLVLRDERLRSLLPV
ncbi:MAG TPA: DoxX family protein, partial [Burkholderiales bacterium]|nr:DoxX family protein [Burkholderiales bacterium]